MDVKVSVERFNDPRYSRPRYRLRYSERQTWLMDGFTRGSFRLKSHAQAIAANENAVSAPLVLTEGAR